MINYKHNGIEGLTRLQQNEQSVDIVKRNNRIYKQYQIKKEMYRLFDDEDKEKVKRLYQIVTNDFLINTYSSSELLMKVIADIVRDNGSQFVLDHS